METTIVPISPKQEQEDGLPASSSSHQNDGQRQQTVLEAKTWALARARQLRYSPTSGRFVQLNLFYRAGTRYEPQLVAETQGNIRTRQYIPVGQHCYFLHPVSAVGYTPEDDTTGQYPKTPGTRLFSGSGMRVMNLTNERPAGFFIPYVDLFHSDVAVSLKRHIGAYQAAKPDQTLALLEETRRIEKGLEIGDALCIPKFLTGDLYHSPEHYGMRHIRNLNQTTLSNQPFYDMPVFSLAPETLPALATELMNKFIAAHPREFLYLEVALQAALVNVHTELHLDRAKENSRSKREEIVDVPQIWMGDWLANVHYYHANHQEHRLAFLYTRSGLWTQLSREINQEHGIKAIGFCPELEEVCIVLSECANSPIGSILPCSIKGSTMPDIGKTRGYLAREDQIYQASARQPDYRSLYFPNLLLDPCLKEKRMEVPNESRLSDPPTRPLIIPSEWATWNKLVPVSVSQKTPVGIPLEVFYEEESTITQPTSILDQRAGESNEVPAQRYHPRALEIPDNKVDGPQDGLLLEGP
ncbi:hypothetical protein B0H66DRAFT_367374 [Apodospora peruviana]|uniref:Uncharacterized protein n=1 Tax=Apodospora peruviana TaxID=516989 RepID=A0AAE0LZW4_9PEZI|nr:hypothetical protein B0H66DRAFT_367374 [Apodospora peruviana]